ncbi:MAG: Crp/Fnr family transcriptional regulator [Phycisphaerae bacterium]|nr:Crp/Fnr family transcriptional regulator [Saprospiraceae bacterium]
MDFSKILDQLAPIAQHFDVSMLDYLEVIAAHTTVRQLRTGDQFPIVGYEDHQAAYIVEGVFRVYSVDATGKETIIRLPAEGDFTMYIENYKTFNPDINYHWEAITDATILTWGKDDLEFLVQNIPSWYFLTLKILQTITLRLTIERGEMFNDDATTRYIKFSERYPHIIARVPLRQVANYLGIAPQSLSRIRQNLTKSSN